MAITSNSDKPAPASNQPLSCELASDGDADIHLRQTGSLADRRIDRMCDKAFGIVAGTAHEAVPMRLEVNAFVLTPTKRQHFAAIDAFIEAPVVRTQRLHILERLANRAGRCVPSFMAQMRCDYRKPSERISIPCLARSAERPPTKRSGTPSFRQGRRVGAVAASRRKWTMRMYSLGPAGMAPGICPLLII